MLSNKAEGLSLINKIMARRVTREEAMTVAATAADAARDAVTTEWSYLLKAAPSGATLWRGNALGRKPHKVNAAAALEVLESFQFLRETQPVFRAQFLEFEAELPAPRQGVRHVPQALVEEDYRVVLGVPTYRALHGGDILLDMAREARRWQEENPGHPGADAEDATELATYYSWLTSRLRRYGYTFRGAGDLQHQVARIMGTARAVSGPTMLELLEGTDLPAEVVEEWGSQPQVAKFAGWDGPEGAAFQLIPAPLDYEWVRKDPDSQDVDVEAFFLNAARTRSRGDRYRGRGGWGNRR